LLIKRAVHDEHHSSGYLAVHREARRHAFARAWSAQRRVRTEFCKGVRYPLDAPAPYDSSRSLHGYFESGNECWL